MFAKFIAVLTTGALLVGIVLFLVFLWNTAKIAGAPTMDAVGKLGEQVGTEIKNTVNPDYVAPTPRPAPTTAPARADDQPVRIIVIPAGSTPVVPQQPAQQVRQTICVTRSDLGRVMKVEKVLVEDGQFAGAQGTLLADLSVQGAPWIDQIHQDRPVNRASARTMASVWIKPDFRCPDP